MPKDDLDRNIVNQDEIAETLKFLDGLSDRPIPCLIFGYGNGVIFEEEGPHTPQVIDEFKLDCLVRAEELHNTQNACQRVKHHRYLEGYESRSHLVVLAFGSDLTVEAWEYLYTQNFDLFDEIEFNPKDENLLPNTSYRHVSQNEQEAFWLERFLNHGMLESRSIPKPPAGNYHCERYDHTHHQEWVFEIYIKNFVQVARQLLLRLMSATNQMDGRAEKENTCSAITSFEEHRPEQEEAQSSDEPDRGDLNAVKQPMDLTAASDPTKNSPAPPQLKPPPPVSNQDQWINGGELAKIRETKTAVMAQERKIAKDKGDVHQDEHGKWGVDPYGTFRQRDPKKRKPVKYYIPGLHIPDNGSLKVRTALELLIEEAKKKASQRAAKSQASET